MAKAADYWIGCGLLLAAAATLHRLPGFLGALFGLLTAGTIVFSNALLVRAMGPGEPGTKGASGVMGMALILKLPIIGTFLALVTFVPVGHFGWFLGGVGLVYSLVLRRAYLSLRGEHGRTSAHD